MVAPGGKYGALPVFVKAWTTQSRLECSRPPNTQIDNMSFKTEHLSESQGFTVNNRRLWSKQNRMCKIYMLAVPSSKGVTLVFIREWMFWAPLPSKFSTPSAGTPGRYWIIQRYIKCLRFSPFPSHEAHHIWTVLSHAFGFVPDV